jgi:metallo-beta-lactamase class B
MENRRLREWLLPAFVLAILGAAPGLAQNQRLEWSKPFPAHKVIGNIYYVGSDNLASFLITTSQGNILINSDYEETVPVVRAAIEKLGFRYGDIKILLGSHAHGDHMEGDAMVKELTGARVMAMQQDVPALTAMKPGGKPHPIDQVLHDGDEVKLGDTTLTAHLTPGHTKGCTTWTTKAMEAGKTYDVLILCSVGVNAGVQLVNNKDYPQIADDYMRSFKILKGLPCEVFLGAHGPFYSLKEKYAKLEKGGANPFIDPAGYQAYLDMMEKTFQAKLEDQKRAAR